jgi:hypothetical protein
MNCYLRVFNCHGVGARVSIDFLTKKEKEKITLFGFRDLIKIQISKNCLVIREIWEMN